MWSHARYDLGLSEAEFWSLTLRQYQALDRRWKQQYDRQEFLAGLLASVTANFSLSRPKKPFAPVDFMPSQAGKPRPKPSQDELVAALNAALMPHAIPSK